MALETLKDLHMVRGFNVVNMETLKEKHPERFNESGSMDYKWFEQEVRPHNFIYLRHDVNSVSFTIQNGPIKESGVNGCQLDSLIEVAKIMIEGLNEKFPCRENALAITKLEEALHWLDHRTKNRINRGVEGRNLQ